MMSQVHIEAVHLYKHLTGCCTGQAGERGDNVRNSLSADLQRHVFVCCVPTTDIAFLREMAMIHAVNYIANTKTLI